VSSLYDKVASPVLTDVRVELDDVGESDVYPRRFGDLFRGPQLVVVGRYRKGGPRAVKLHGKVGTRDVSFVYEATFGDGAGTEFLPRLWAVRKVGFLLDEIRRNGEQPELVAEIKKLGIRHGIVTPYTSFLVAEERELRRAGLGAGGSAGGPTTPGAPEADARALDDMEDEAADAGDAYRGRAEGGKKAVGGARLAERLKHAGVPGKVGGIGVKQVDGKTFRLEAGVWTDAAVAGKEGPVQKIVYLSDAYVALLADATLARYLSVGPRVKVWYRDAIYEITEE